MTKVGIGLMALGVGVWAAWNAWMRTRTMNPVEIPVTIAVGASTASNFELNYDGLYLIEIAAQGADLSELETINAEWNLRSDGQEVQRGSTDEAHSAPGGGQGGARVIGEFHGRSGHRYELRVKFTADAPTLQKANPRLRVAVSGLAQENLHAANLLVFSTMFICELFGVILVGVGAWGRAAAGQRDPSHKSE